MTRKSKLTMRQREAIEGYLCLLPWILGFIFFSVGPAVTSLILSLSDYNILLSSSAWIGLENYGRLLHDPLFWQSLKVTVLYTTGAIPLGLATSLVLALLMNQKLKAIALFRTIYYLPMLVGGVAVALLWQWIFNPNFGIINWILWELFRVIGPDWLLSETWTIPAFIIMSLWTTGAGMIIFLAGLQGIPVALYEAAEIDGASWWKKFWKITIPMLSPVIFFNLIMGLIGSFQIFTQSYIMTNGGPHNASLFYVLYLFFKGFQDYQMGYASALAWVLFIVILACTLLVFKSSPMWVYYEAKRRG